MPTVRLRPERIPVAAALSAVGGALDAYTYLAHGGVFANAQTGNVVLFGVDAAHGGWARAVRHVWPVLAFIVGVLTVEALARSRPRIPRPTRVVLAIETVTLAVVGALPQGTPNVVSTVLIAWSATLQVATFRSADGIAYNTTFTTGNLRNLVSAAVGWSRERDPDRRRETVVLAAVVSSFAAGALLGGLLTEAIGDRAVWAPAAVLPLVAVVLAVETRRLESG